jgi:hypothetical protein
METTGLMQGHRATEATAVDAAVQRLVTFLETGEAAPGLFTEDVFTDFTLPTWRLQASGRAECVALRRGGHPSPGRVVRRRVLPTAEGFVMEFEERWQDAADDWYCREMIAAMLRGESICELSVYCTGDWGSRRQAEHAASVQLLRP